VIGPYEIALQVGFDISLVAYRARLLGATPAIVLQALVNAVATFIATEVEVTHHAEAIAAVRENVAGDMARATASAHAQWGAPVLFEVAVELDAAHRETLKETWHAFGSATLVALTSGVAQGHVLAGLTMALTLFIAREIPVEQQAATIAWTERAMRDMVPAVRRAEAAAEIDAFTAFPDEPPASSAQ
jgi:hypothetical protein